MTRVAVALVLLLSLGTLAAGGEQGPEGRTEPGRYRMAVAGERIILLDTVTGESWVLAQEDKAKEKFTWVPIERKQTSSSNEERVSLKGMYATVSYGEDVERANLPDELIKSTKDRQKPTAFLVQAKDINSAVKLTALGLTKETVARPLADQENASKNDYWLVVYLGWTWIEPAQWFVDSVQLDNGRIRVQISRTQKKGVAFVEWPYIFWIPIHKLQPGAYRIEIYEEKEDLTVSQDTNIPGK